MGDSCCWRTPKGFCRSRWCQQKDAKVRDGCLDGHHHHIDHHPFHFCPPCVLGCPHPRRPRRRPSRPTPQARPPRRPPSRQGNLPTPTSLRSRKTSSPSTPSTGTRREPEEGVSGFLFFSPPLSHPQPPNNHLSNQPTNHRINHRINHRPTEPK